MNTRAYSIRTWGRAFRIGIALAAGLGFAHTASAEGGIEGTVIDSTIRTALEGAEVNVPAYGRKAFTNRRGYFRITGLPTGPTEVEIRYIGADPVRRSVTVVDNQIAAINAEMALEFFELEAIEVSSPQSASMRAQNVQRSSANLKDVVASDFLGRFPDGNTAEALNRLPGISVERDQGEGRFVIIRGINPDLNSVSIDGIKLAAPSDDERKTLLDTIPNEVMETLEVTKAVLPDQPGDSIGGHIEIRTPSAFDRTERTMRANAQLHYSDLTDELGSEFSFAFGDRLGANENVGLFLTAVWSQRNFGSDNQEADEWGEEDAVDPDNGQEYYAQTGEFQFREYDLSRTRTGMSANLEFKPSDNAFYFARLSWNEYTDHEIRHRGIINFEDAEFLRLREADVTAEGVEIVREHKDREENMRIAAFSVGGMNRIEDWQIDYTLAYSFAEEDTPFDTEFIYELEDSITMAAGRLKTYNPNFSFIADSGPSPYNAANYEFDEVADAFQDVEERDWTGKIDIRRDFNADVLRYIKFGGVARVKSKENDAEETASDDNPGSFDTMDAFLNTNVRDPYESNLPLISGNIRDAFLENESAFAMERDEEGSLVEDYDSDEDVYAGYAMVALGRGPWEVIAGFRVEHTEFSSAGNQFLDDEDDDTPEFSMVEFEKDYTNFMPGIHLRVDVGENAVFRAAYTNTIARPNFGQSFAGQVVEAGDEAEIGNPMLDPYESQNFDLSLQFYEGNVGVFSIAGFYKDIDNFIYAQTLPNGFDADGDGDGDTDLTTFRNGESGDILGLEVSYQRRFDFLPGPLAGFSGYASVTFSDGEAVVLAEELGDDDRELPFLKQSDLIYNLALTYEWDNLFLRLAGTYRDEYLDEVGGDFDEDRYVDEHFQVDLFGSYQITSSLSLFVELVNLTNEPFRAYWGESRRLSQFEEYGFSGSLGFKYNY